MRLDIREETRRELGTKSRQEVDTEVELPPRRVDSFPTSLEVLYKQDRVQKAHENRMRGAVFGVPLRGSCFREKEPWFASP